MVSEELVQLIELVESNDCIYKSTSPKYMRTKLIEHAWRKIAKRLNWTVLECKEKWKCIRRGLVRSLRPSSSNRRPYYLYDYLQFLIPHVQIVEVTKYENKDEIKINIRGLENERHGKERNAKERNEAATQPTSTRRTKRWKGTEVLPPTRPKKKPKILDETGEDAKERKDAATQTTPTRRTKRCKGTEIDEIWSPTGPKILDETRQGILTESDIEFLNFQIETLPLLDMQGKPKPQSPIYPAFAYNYLNNDLPEFTLTPEIIHQYLNGNQGEDLNDKEDISVGDEFNN